MTFFFWFIFFSGKATFHCLMRLCVRGDEGMGVGPKPCLLLYAIEQEHALLPLSYHRRSLPARRTETSLSQKEGKDSRGSHRLRSRTTRWQPEACTHIDIEDDLTLLPSIGLTRNLQHI